MQVDELYERCQSEPSDINEHLPTLFRYGKECKSVTEMGVRSGRSTTAFLAARPESLISYDIDGTYFREHVEPGYAKAAAEAGVSFRFEVADVLGIEIAPTDLLFIDTWHVYDQLIQELRTHSPRVRKYILLHDTETFGYVGEQTKGDRIKKDIAGFLARTLSPKLSFEVPARGGLKAAVAQFLEEDPRWEQREHFTNNNGLTVLARIKD